ncbi:class I SAM-dependent methyltransferase [Nocardioides iriomotensis]|uniref:class I SAM-dependent methyltransferase n=1 Tax=Nocardioides iriomotensis TaxID=715784 RepID=UPI00197E336C|nr:class I SAM-dependent methyltransferase [Nocardioides iriomotensis]
MPPSNPEKIDMSGVRRAYDVVAEDYAARLPDNRSEAAIDLAMVDAFAAAVDEGAILDAGCGAGRMSRYLLRRGCDVEGVDLSPGMVAMARRDTPGVRFTVGSLADLPYPDGSFAGVLLWYSIIHTAPAGQDRIFAEAARVLRPGGHLLVGFQAGTGTKDVSAAYSRYGHDVELERHLFTADEVAARLEAVRVRELTRLVRRAEGPEHDDQAIVLGRRSAQTR